MPLPTGVLTGTVRGDHVVDATGALATGTLTLRPVTRVAGHDTVITASAVTLTATNGVITPTVVAATDDPGLIPAGWRYEVREQFNGTYTAPYYIEVPAGGTVDLASVARSDTLPAYTRLVSTVNGVAPDPTGDVVLDASALLPEIADDIAAAGTAAAAAQSTANSAATAATAAVGAAAASSTAAGAAQTTATNAANLAAAALPRGEVGVTAAPSRALLYDRAQRPDGPLGTSESGVVWSASGPNPLVISGGAITLPGATGTGYAVARLTTTPRVIGGRFRPTTTGSMTILCNDEATFTGETQGIAAHLVVTLTGAVLHYRVGNGPFVVVPGAEWAFAPALEVGKTYAASLSIDPDASAVTVRLPQGKIGRFVYPQAAALAGATAVWEISTTAGTPGRWEEVWAVAADLPVLPYVSADDLGEVLGGLYDTLGNVVSQPGTEHEVTIGRTPAGLAGVMLGQTVLAYPFGGGLVWLPHNTIVAGSGADRTLTTSVELAAGLAGKISGTDPRLTDAREPTASPHATAFGLLATPCEPHHCTLSARIGSGRMTLSWLPMPAGTSVRGVAVALDALAVPDGGAVWVVAYQEDLSQLGVSADLAAALSGGSPQTWRKAPFTGGADETTGAGIWVGYLTTMAANSNAPQVRLAAATGQDAWVQNPPWRRRALRVEGLTGPPATLDLSAAVDYVDIAIGAYAP